MASIEVYPVFMQLGTTGSDTLRAGSDATLIGLSGDDTLISEGLGITSLLGGEGNDKYIAEGIVSEIFDSGGQDTLQLAGRAEDYVGGFINGQHLLFYNGVSGDTALVLDFKGAGRIETFTDASGVRLGADEIQDRVYQEGRGDISFTELQYAGGSYGFDNQTFEAALELDMVFGQIGWPSVFRELSEHDMNKGAVIADAIQAETMPLLSPVANQLWREGGVYQALANSTFQGLAANQRPSLEFDNAYYLENNKDVAQAVASGVVQSARYHWENFGVYEGRNPNAIFDTQYYLNANSDVAEAGINPLTHFLAFGASEGRAPNLSHAVIARRFDEQAYLEANADVSIAVKNGGLASGYEHWVLHGQFEARPEATFNGGVPISFPFDSSYYLQNNPDVATAGINPLGHFLDFGAAEGRAPNASYAPVSQGFDGQAYLAENPDVASAVQNGAFANGYQHWVLYGQFEPRAEATFNGGVPASNAIATGNTFKLTAGEGENTLIGQDPQAIIDLLTSLGLSSREMNDEELRELASSTYAETVSITGFDQDKDIQDSLNENFAMLSVQEGVSRQQAFTAAAEAAAESPNGYVILLMAENDWFVYADSDQSQGLSKDDFVIELVGTQQLASSSGDIALI